MRKLALPLLAAFLSLGLSLPAAGAQATPAYVALGDSLAAGIGAPSPASEGYVALAFDALRKGDRYRGLGLELVNLGVPGATSADLLLAGGQLQRALDEIERRGDEGAAGAVEIISIDIGGNDLLQVAAARSPCSSDPLGQACQQLFAEMLSGLESNLGRTLRELRQAAPEATIIVVGLYNPYSGTGAALELTADFAIQQVNAVYRRVADQPQLDARMAEVFELFRGRGPQWIAADGLHPNGKGHAVIAEALLAAIEGREPVLPSDLLEEPAAPSAGGDPPLASAQAEGNPSASRDGAGGDTNLLIVLAIAIPAAFAAGVVIAGAFFLARGRP